MKQYLVQEFKNKLTPIKIVTDSAIIDDNVVALARTKANQFVDDKLEELEKNLKDVPNMYSRTVYKNVNDINYVTTVNSLTDMYVHIFIADVEINIYESYATDRP